MKKILIFLLLTSACWGKFKWGYQHGNSQNTVLLLHLNYGEGTTAYDVSGKGNNGTISGALWVNGLFGKCLDFDGDENSGDDYINLGQIGITGSQNRTFTCWAYIETQTNSTETEIFSVGSHSNYETWQFGILTNVDPDVFRVEIEGAGFSFSISPEYNNWYFIALVLDGNTVGDHILYVCHNNTWEKEQATGTTTLNTAVSDWYVGRGYRDFGINGGYRTWNGKIEEAVFWNRALSPAEIKHIYQSQSGRYN